ncbi:MAG: CARDB domain-containing protein [Candidatus Micrarchaeaceae archaeon]
MKKIISIGLLYALITLFIPNIIGAQSINNALSVTNLQISPNPILAGSQIHLSFQIYDSYSSELTNVNLQLQGSYPILNFSPTNSYLINEMSQGIYGGSSSYFNYNINIPKSTPSGTYVLNILATYQTTQTVSGGTETITGSSVIPITFYVSGAPNITVTSEPGNINPGQNFEVSLNVLNSGYGSAKNITISLLNNSEFIPIGAKSFNIGYLGQSSSDQLTATYKANNFIENGTYSIPIQISYHAITGTKYTQNQNQSVSVLINNPNIVVTVESEQPQTLYKGYNQSLVLGITNIGTGTAENVSLGFFSGKGINVLSSVSNFFIGSISPGQTVQESLLISASNFGSSNSSFYSYLKYLSSNYKSIFEKNQTIPINVASSSTFNITNGTYSITPGSTAVPLNLIITNTGNINAENIQLSLQSNYPITPVTSSYYISSLSPGQSANVSFEVSADSNANLGTYPITIYETWKQPNGAVEQAYSGTNVYYATITNGSSNNSEQFVNIVIVVIVIIVLFTIYRRIKTSKKKK